MSISWGNVDTALIITAMDSFNRKGYILSFMFGGDCHYYKVSCNAGERPYPYVTFEFPGQAEAKIYSLAERLGVNIGE